MPKFLNPIIFGDNTSQSTAWTNTATPSFYPFIDTPTAGSLRFGANDGGMYYYTLTGDWAPMNTNRIGTKNVVRLASVGALPTYAASNNGKTITASANGALSIDGTPVVGDRVLVKDERATPLYNGIYTILTIGSASTTWSMTRTDDFDDPVNTTAGALVAVRKDSPLMGNTIWMLATYSTPTPGQQPLYFTRVSPPNIPGGSRYQWDLFGNISANMPRWYVRDYVFQPTPATTRVIGGVSLLANQTIIGTSFLILQPGASFTVKWAALTDGALNVLAVSTNNTAAWTANAVNNINFATTYTPPIDMGAYIVLGTASTTAFSMGGITGLATPLSIPGGFSNATVGVSSTTATSSPPAVGTTLGSLSVGMSSSGIFMPWVTVNNL